MSGYHPLAVVEGHTTAVVERYLNELAGVPGDAPADPVIRILLSSSVDRLQLLCATLLHRKYPRLTKPPLNLQTEEMLSSVVERMIKALQKVRPKTVREFFALANQHMRWELNDLARRLDHETRAVELRESIVESPGAQQDTAGSPMSANTARILQAIETLPDDERETFGLVRVQGMSCADAAVVVGVSVKTIQRRLNRALPLLASQLQDLHPDVPLSGNA